MLKAKATASLLAAILIGGTLGAAGCEGAAGTPGKDGTNGVDGTNGTDGVNGTNGSDGVNGTDGQPGAPGQDGVDGGNGKDGTDGTNGKNGGNVAVTNFHGTEALAQAEYDSAGKYHVKATISSATVTGGVVTVDFAVEDESGAPLVGLKTVSASIAKLVPPATGEKWNKWVPYIYRKETVTTTGEWKNPVGTEANQGYRESNGTLTDNGDGTYTYVYKTDISAVTLPVGGTAVPYEANRRTRVSIMFGGHTGPTADASFDFVPDGTPLANVEHRDIVRTETCKSCHGPEFHGHGGDRLSVENCVTCHAPGSSDAHGGETIDFAVMIHKIHAGGELASIAGPDGILWDNPATTADESADNGKYAIWGYNNTKLEWWKAGFPAVIENCAKCHDGTGADSDNWKNAPSRKVCGSCHDNVNFATGANHPSPGGVQTSDANCTACHPATGGSPTLPSVSLAHDFMNKFDQNKPEFKVELSFMNPPANGTHFVAGETPIVKVVLKDLENGGVALTNHDALKAGAAKGCTTNPCPAKADPTVLAKSDVFVNGPRGGRNPVLTTRARVELIGGAGPFDISAAGAKLDIKFDGGQDIYSEKNGGKIVAATVSVPVPPVSTPPNQYIPDPAAATADQVVAWLNANAGFKARGIAYKEGNNVAIRSRNLGERFQIQLLNGAATCPGTSTPVCAIFGNNTTVQVVGGYTVANSIAIQTNPANDDPKVVRYPDYLEYHLDPVADLAPGTYIVNAEIAARGRVDAVNYKTPSVAKLAFQVGTATVELPPSADCDSCHQSKDGAGFILDYSRHYKIFDQSAVDQCGACHDYQSQNATGAWAGAGPISRRVHAVHNGSALNYPLITVGYSNGDPVPGRNWDITLPQDVRNCDTTCHKPGTTSGSWKTAAARTPCYGCHDSDAAVAHMKIMTYDPTPLDPWSGDEQESCQTCH